MAGECFIHHTMPLRHIIKSYDIELMPKKMIMTPINIVHTLLLAIGGSHFRQISAPETFTQMCLDLLQFEWGKLRKAFVDGAGVG